MWDLLDSPLSHARHSSNLFYIKTLVNIYMDPAEEIVNLWLKQTGYFIIPNIKVGYRGKEIDFLAISFNKDGTINKKLHVEVHASVSPLGPLQP